jgi:hypothetical protein
MLSELIDARNEFDLFRCTVVREIFSSRSSARFRSFCQRQISLPALAFAY